MAPKGERMTTMMSDCQDYTLTITREGEGVELQCVKRDTGHIESRTLSRFNARMLAMGTPIHVEGADIAGYAETGISWELRAGRDAAVFAGARLAIMDAVADNPEEPEPEPRPDTSDAPALREAYWAFFDLVIRSEEAALDGDMHECARRTVDACDALREVERVVEAMKGAM